MFDSDERGRLRDALVTAARADRRITAAAVTGSGALDAEDRWSDIDLVFGVAAGADLDEVRADWTDLMYRQHQAVHHLELAFGSTVFRVFVLASTLQVDLAFAPAAEFGAIAPTFRLLFGTAVQRTPLPEPEPARLVGMGWLYALHARSSIARGRLWQAEYMVSGLRDQVLALACRRHGLPATEGRGVDGLPPEVTGAAAGALVRSPDAGELARAFRSATELLLVEIGLVDADLAGRLAGVLRELLPPADRRGGTAAGGVRRDGDQHRLRCAVVLGVDEERCAVRSGGAVVPLRFAPQFPSPRTERVSPGHLVAVATAPDGGGVVVWRWYDAVVLGDDGAGSVRLWEPAHGEVLARARPSYERREPGSRAYASAGLPGADWWVAGPADADADDAAVELDAVDALYTEHDLWPAALGLNA